SVTTDQEQIQQQKPYLDPSIRQVLTIERAGVVDVYALGSLMLKLARRQGVKFLQGNVSDIQRERAGYALQVGPQSLHAQQLILCGGPFTAELAGYLGIELPVYSVAQRKFVIPDPRNIIPRDMPFTIYADSQKLPWSEQELELINGDKDYSHLLNDFPAGLHIKPEGRQQIKMGWAFNRAAEKPAWDLQTDHEFPSVVMRGATRFIPGLASYVDDVPTPIVQFAGYYTRTEENLPLIGELEENLLVVSALAGYGTMSACAAGHLCAAQSNQASLPDYAPYLSPQRYLSTALMREIRSINADGQL
ncbi:MAG: FAD-binding oxidoreductase, partial [Gammaproteobacteria bacterium]|nr:FAD-binding oxidoreductase [Gammaproteobacteria bacterium]